LDDPDGGRVQLRGQRLSRRPEAERAVLRAENIGIFLQSGNLFDHLSVADNIRLGQRLAGKPDERRLDTLIEQFGLERRKSAARYISPGARRPAPGWLLPLRPIRPYL